MGWDGTALPPLPQPNHSSAAAPSPSGFPSILAAVCSVCCVCCVLSCGTCRPCRHGMGGMGRVGKLLQVLAMAPPGQYNYSSVGVRGRASTSTFEQGER